MIALTLAEIAHDTGGTLVGGADPSAVVTGRVTVDSREVAPGALFVALPGDRVDGHDFVDVALAAGAAGVLLSRDLGVPGVLVADGVAAVTALATAVLARLRAAGDLTVVGVTGSSGKTSTKDLLATVLSAVGPTVAPQGSFNNELGVPLTVLKADTETRWLVVEMGARGVGHIRHLCRIAPPDIAVVLNVGLAHASEFGDPDTTALAKGELVEALAPDGVAVLTLDDPRVAAMATRTRGRVVRVGLGAGADVRADDVTLDDEARAAFTLVTPEGSAPVHLVVHGEHHVRNALSAAAVGREAGLPVAQVADLLSRAAAGSRWRMEVTRRADGLTVINDAYNANPESMAAGLRALAAMGTSPSRRTWAVLGEMRELGDRAGAQHHAAGELAASLGVTRVVAVGAAAAAVAEGARAAGAQAIAVPDIEGALTVLIEAAPDDVVLVKASRGAGLDRLAAGLLAADAAEWAPATPVHTGSSTQVPTGEGTPC